VAQKSRRGHVGLHSPEATRHVLNAQASADASCFDPDGEGAGIAVVPVRGKAVVFYHEERGGEGVADDDHLRRADPLAWHCACVVKEGGSDRWALQKFKAHPQGGSAPRRFYDVLEAHHTKLVWGGNVDDETTEVRGSIDSNRIAGGAGFGGEKDEV